MTETCLKCNRIAVRSEFDQNYVCTGCNYYIWACTCEKFRKPIITAKIPHMPNSMLSESIDNTESLDTMKSIVFKLLSEDENCRNDDTWLQYRICKDVLKLPIFQKMEFEEMAAIPKFETIRRVRQEIQNTEKRFPPTDPEVVEQREKNRQRVSKWAANMKKIYNNEMS